MVYKSSLPISFFFPFSPQRPRAPMGALYITINGAVLTVLKMILSNLAHTHY